MAMKLTDLIQRNPSPLPWAEGDNIPWNDPAFSERMLKEHLSQSHDAASRRFVTVDKHVSWIHNFLLKGQVSRVLDLGCGPGLYSNRLAHLGHTCLGIDYSPASIRYARQTAAAENLPCQYVHEDIRKADYGTGYHLVMLIFGEFNVFKPADVHTILSKAWQALLPGGILLLEPQSFDGVAKNGQQPASWFSQESGLFSERPYLGLQENFWDPESYAATTRYYIIDAGTAEVTPYAQSIQAYTDNDYSEVLAKHGFSQVAFYPALGVMPGSPQQEFFGLTAVK